MADEDDPFIYGEDGVPESVKAPEYELTEEELHDVTVAVNAENDFEALMLISALEDAGIPAMKKRGLVHFGQLNSVEVVVPRKLLKAAQELVAKTRAEASERGVENAFKEESVEERAMDPRGDETTEKMLEIASGPAEMRAEKLTPFVADWLAEGRTAPEMARYLASAGLSREESEALIAGTKTERTDLVAASLDRRMMTGLGVAATGIAVFLFACIPWGMVIGMCLFVAGLGIAALSWSERQKLQ